MDPETQTEVGRLSELPLGGIQVMTPSLVAWMDVSDKYIFLRLFYSLNVRRLKLFIHYPLGRR